MNKKRISQILLIVFIITMMLTVANIFLHDSNTQENQTGTLNISNKTVHYEKAGKCLEVIDGNTIQVYGVGRVQLIQVDTPDKEPGLSQAKKFVEDRCLGKTVYLDIDDKQSEDKYGRTLAIVYTDTSDINKELLENSLANVSYFTPSEFKKGEV
ncbi:MAG: thermonuclease family protein [Methanobrevibacter sp.]|uniref:thermonuclease family protein n=1 Tax=Methanobrevibacter sp. TaxID=66852 RepID=UPI0025E82D37|nr:thermonuclease family protein [Methanobrevibacter sp.]MBR6993058.1 thermonuclease family protein [Methanobrevibacter sp.]